MQKRRTIQFAIIALLVVFLALALPIPSNYSYAAGDSITPLFVADTFGTPTDWMTSLVACAGGLPRQSGRYVTAGKTNLPVPLCLAQSVAAPIELWEVSRWDLTRITVNGSWGPLLEFIPIPFMNLGESRHAPRYAITAEYRVRYADGETRLLRWETWRWGVTLGPLVLDTGHGPAGDVIVLE